MMFTRRKNDRTVDTPATPATEELHVVLYREQAYGEDDQRTEFQTAEQAKAFVAESKQAKRWAEYRRELKAGH